MKTGLLTLAGVAALAAVVAVAFVGGAAGGVARFNGTLRASTDVSSNWSGYVATRLDSTATAASPASAFKSVTATWKQPTARCDTAGAAGSASAMWVGLGGGSDTTSDALEQVGTSADCSPTGEPSYYAWYELVPDPSVTVKSLKIAPGDTITASVVVDGTQILFWLKNRTRQTVFSKRMTFDEPDLSSAEWIAEAPSGCTSREVCRQLPLANFGSVTFTRVAALATIAGLGDQGGTVSSTFWESTPVRLVPDAAQHYYGGYSQRPDATAGIAGAKPLGLSADGSSFTVNWVARPKP